MASLLRCCVIIGLLAICGKVAWGQGLQVSFGDSFYTAISETTTGQHRYAIFHYGDGYGDIQAAVIGSLDKDYDDFKEALTDTEGSILCSFGLYNVGRGGAPGPFIFISWFSPDGGMEIGNCAMRNGLVHSEVRKLIAGVKLLTVASDAQLDWGHVSNGI